ncbi:cutinase [Thozetella sp. PMI_491]|nr:cutinase [Thozetella sp. PMI_491]
MKLSVLASLAAGAAALPNPLARRQYSGDTYNQLTDGTPCRAVTLIYARGTTQAGNVGDAAAVGPLFFNALAALIGESNLAVQGVTYAADIIGFLQGGDPAGSKLMASLVSTAATQCPNTKIVLSGYSQGGQLVHNAAANLTTALTNKINSVLIFGDPDDGQAVGSIPSSKVKIICHDGDLICDGTIIVTSQHTNYQQDVGTAASWVAGKVA